jgi:hypothetical protein
MTITLNVDLDRDTGDEAADLNAGLPDGGVYLEVTIEPSNSQLRLALGAAKDAFVNSLKEQGVVLDDVTFFS